MNRITAARERFPGGLKQPAGGMRFGMDALLLAAFTASYGTKAFSVAELGCGCGAALLGFALLRHEGKCCGLERDEVLCAAAQDNASLLGLEDRVSFLHYDLADIAPHPDRFPARFDMVMANPPYGLSGQGRSSPLPRRESALRDTAALPVFCKAAATLLRHHGYFFCIFAANALPRLCAALGEAAFGLRRVVPVRAYRAAPALRVLVEARYGAAHDVRLEAPLTLHSKIGATPSWTPRALRFCPWLAK
ncbi:MAG: methyltransferase domain-containing protein [Desulfovibrio sp.]|nr:methyltransferase domain-containing protein [Desulfovibrio sp.]